VFSTIRGLRESVDRLTAAVQEIADSQSVSGLSEERLADLERTRALWEAEIEALVLKAEGSYKSASNAEARARTMEKHVEKQLDPFGGEGEEIPEAVPAGDVEGGEEDGVPPVYLDVAEDDKTRALRMKFS